MFFLVFYFFASFRFIYAGCQLAVEDTLEILLHFTVSGMSKQKSSQTYDSYSRYTRLLWHVVVIID